MELRFTEQEERTEAVKTAKKRKTAAKRVETLEEAEARLLSLYITEMERRMVRTVISKLKDGTVRRLRVGKISKKEVDELHEQINETFEKEQREKRIAETLKTKPSNYHVITDNRDLAVMMQRLAEEIRLQQEHPWFQKVFELFNNTLIRKKLSERGIHIPAVQSFTAMDTETSGLDKMQDLTGGYSLWLPLLDEGYYVAYGHLTGDKQCSRFKALSTIADYLSDASHVKSYQNAPFDLNMFLNDGLEPRGFRYDSKDAQFILNDHEESYSLKPLVTKYKKHIGIDFDDFTFEDLFGNTSPMIYPVEVVGIYAVKDVHKGWALTKWQIDMMLAKDNLHVPYFEIHQYLPEVNVNIERTGFRIDLDELKSLSAQYHPLKDAAHKAIFDTYKIDSEFLYNMSMALKGEKIQKWIDDQRGRIQKQADMLKRCKDDLRQTKSTTKKYADLVDRIRRYENTTLPEAVPQNAPDYITEFKLSSDEHIAYLIYDHLGIKDRTKTVVKDKNRERAVSADVLELYFTEEASLKPLAEYSKFDKLLGTYVDKIPEALDVDCRLHTQFRTVSTGRYGSSGYSGKPNGLRPAEIDDSNYLAAMRALVDCNEKVSKGTNLQNIPSRNEEGLRVRKTFKPTVGYTFLASDLSSIEPRIQAHRMASEFGDEIFAEMFRKRLDPYIEFASILFEVPKEVCSEDAYKRLKKTTEAVPPYRKMMKSLFLARGYGQAFEQFYKLVNKYGVTEEHARRAYDKFDEVLPGFGQMVESTFKQLRQHGWVATLWHQKRRFPQYQDQWTKLCVLMKRAGITSKNDPELSKKTRKLPTELRSQFWQLLRETGRAERQAFNHTIQGTGANILQLCMIRSYYECTLARGWEFNLTLHDEQKHSVPNDQLTPEAVELYTDIMTNTVKLLLPLECDTVIEPVWMDERKPSDWFKQEVV